MSTYVYVYIFIYIHMYKWISTKYTPMKFVFLFYNKAIAQRCITPAFK